MVGVGFFVFFVGYSVLAYGWSQIRGCNAGLFSLIIPGKYTGCNPDGSSSSPPAPPKSKPKTVIPPAPTGKTGVPSKVGPTPGIPGFIAPM